MEISIPVTATGLSGVWAVLEYCRVLCSVKERKKGGKLFVGVCVMEVLVYDFGVVEVRLWVSNLTGYTRPACQIHVSGEIRSKKN